MLVMVRGAGFPHIRKQFDNRILGRSRHSASRADRAAFNEAADDLVL